MPGNGSVTSFLRAAPPHESEFGGGGEVKQRVSVRGSGERGRGMGTKAGGGKGSAAREIYGGYSCG